MPRQDLPAEHRNEGVREERIQCPVRREATVVVFVSGPCAYDFAVVSEHLTRVSVTIAIKIDLPNRHHSTPVAAS